MIISPQPMSNEAKVRQDLDFLLQCFHEVLEEKGEADLARHLLYILEDKGVSTPAQALQADESDPQRLAQAYSIGFRLLSMVEENAAAQLRRTTETAEGMAHLSGLWAQNLTHPVSSAGASLASTSQDGMGWEAS